MTQICAITLLVLSTFSPRPDLIFGDCRNSAGVGKWTARFIRQSPPRWLQCKSCLIASSAHVDRHGGTEVVSIRTSCSQTNARQAWGSGRRRASIGSNQPVKSKIRIEFFQGRNSMKIPLVATLAAAIALSSCNAETPQEAAALDR